MSTTGPAADGHKVGELGLPLAVSELRGQAAHHDAGCAGEQFVQPGTTTIFSSIAKTFTAFGMAAAAMPPDLKVLQAKASGTEHEAEGPHV